MILISVLGVGSLTKYFIAESKSVQIAAHRGDMSKAPENTLSSIKYAIEDKTDYIQCDIQETKDGIVVLSHDRNTKRVSKDDKVITDTNFEELENIEVGSYYSDKFKGEKIPTLEEVIKYVDGKSKLNIEIKPYGDNGLLVENTVKLLEDNNLSDECIVSSFDKNILQKVKKLNPKIKTMYLTSFANEDILKDNLVDIYGVLYTRLDKKIVDKIHKNNKKIWAWSINEKEEMNKLVDMGIDGVITDRPDVVKDISK